MSRSATRFASFVKSRGPADERCGKIRRARRGTAIIGSWPVVRFRALSVGPFRAAEAAEAGISRRRLRADDVGHPHHGLYLPYAEDVDLRSRCETFAQLLGPDRWFSHLTAARIWGIPLPTRWSESEPLHVIAIREAAPTRRPKVVGWETRRTDIDRVVLGLIPLIAPAEVWCQLAVPGATGTDAETGRKRNLSLPRLVAAADFLLTGPYVRRARLPLCTREDLQSALRSNRGARGTKTLTIALELARAGAHSPKETELRLGLMACGLPEPDVQVPVMTASGLRHADLGYPDARVVLEYQGDHHRSDRKQWLDDLHRVQLMQDAGFHVVQVGAHDLVPDCSDLAARVRRALAGQYFRLESR